MKKIFSLMLALMLGLSCTGALAEATAPSSASASFTIALDEEILYSLLEVEPTEENAAIMDMIMPLIENVGFQMVSTSEGNEISLTLKGTPLCTVGYYLEADGMTILSDLFPNYAITVPMEGAELSAAAEDQMIAALMQHLAAFDAKLNSMSAVETGAFEVNGAIFDTKATLELNLHQSASLMMDLCIALLSDEALIEYIALPEAAEYLAQFQAMKAELEVMTEEEIAQVPGGLNMYTYTMEGSEDVYLTGSAITEDYLFFADMNAMDKETHLTLAFGESEFTDKETVIQYAKEGSDECMLLEANILMGEAENDMQIKAALYAEQYLGLNFHTAALPLIGQSVNIEISLTPDADPALKLSGAILAGGELSMKNTLTPAETIAISPALLSGSVDYSSMAEEELNQYMLDAIQLEEDLTKLEEDINIYGANALMANASAAMPQEISTLLMYIMQMAQVTEEAAETEVIKENPAE